MLVPGQGRWIGGPRVGDHCGPCSDISLNKGLQALLRGIFDESQPGTPPPMLGHLNGTCDQCLSQGTTALHPGLGPPKNVSSTSTLPASGALSEVDMSRRSFASIVQAVWYEEIGSTR